MNLLSSNKLAISRGIISERLELLPGFLELSDRVSFLVFGVIFFPFAEADVVALAGERRVGEDVNDLVVPVLLLLRGRSWLKMLAISNSIGKGVGVFVDGGDTSDLRSGFDAALDCC
jgi:hypothetical protein